MENVVTMDLSNCFETEPPSLDFVIPGFLSGDVGALVSPGGSGKSFLALNIAVATSTGHDLTSGALGVTSTGKVTYLNAEDAPDALRRRLHALGQFLSPDVRGEMIECMTIKSLRGLNCWLLDETGRENAKAVDWLLNEAKDQRLVILDTLRRFHLGDENSSGQMAHLLGILESIASQTGASFLFLHHTNKSAATNGNGGEQGASRGSSVLVDNARYQANLTTMTPQEAQKLGIQEERRRWYVKFQTSKCNNAEPNEEIWLFRNTGGILTRADFGNAVNSNVRRFSRGY